MPQTRARSGSSSARPVTLRDVHAGRILWLMPKDGCAGGGAADVDDGCFDHPVVVLWADELMKEAIVLIITSFDCHDLRERHPTNHQVRALYLPIRPSAPHPDNGHLLALHGGKTLSKKSYVNTEQPHRIRFEMLRPYMKGGERDFKLSKQSLSLLKKYIKFAPPSPRMAQPAPYPAITEVPPPRRTRTYPDVADLPRVSSSAASVPYSWTTGQGAQDSRMLGYLPYDERRPLVSPIDPPPEGGSYSSMYRLLIALIVGGACVGMYFAARYAFHSRKAVQEPVEGKWGSWVGAVPEAVQLVREQLRL